MFSKFKGRPSEADFKALRIIWAPHPIPINGFVRDDCNSVNTLVSRVVSPQKLILALLRQNVTTFSIKLLSVNT